LKQTSAAMFCSISGTTPEDPVISSKTGHLYERSLITKALQVRSFRSPPFPRDLRGGPNPPRRWEKRRVSRPPGVKISKPTFAPHPDLSPQETGECPVTKTPMTLEDLLEVKSSKMVKPRATAAASIPGLLSIFHNEWDALMLETHELRVDLHGTRQELSHALYQHDAACRVISRLIKERDEAREALTNARAAGPAAAPGGKRSKDASEAMDVDGGDGKKARGGIPPGAVDAMTSKSKELSKGRKKREISPDLATPEAIASMSVGSNAPCHATKAKGIHAIRVNPNDANEVATGGADGSVALFDAAKGKRATLMTGHKKAVTDIAFAGEVILTSSVDKTVKIWADGSEKASVAGVHEGEVTAVSAHPTNAYAVSIGGDGAWAFMDIAQAECLSVTRDADGAKYTCGGFHPDGLILGTGAADSSVKIWDVKSSKVAAKVEGHVGAVRSMSFSENGYYLATCAEDGVKLWDLRKLKNFKSFEAAGVRCVGFDHSGHYLAVGGADACVHNVKAEWEVVKRWEASKAPVHALAFAADAKAIYAGCSDHNLRVIA
jgi:pre-mRNA-processing factor 19